MGSVVQLLVIDGDKAEREKLLRAGLDSAQGNPSGFRVQRLNHSAITA